MKKKENKKDNAKKDKLSNRRADHEKKIKTRLKKIKEITEPYSHMKEMRMVDKKFQQAYKERIEFGHELMNAKQNCISLKSKVDEFLKQQNMLMIKLKGGFRKKNNS